MNIFTPNESFCQVTRYLILLSSKIYFREVNCPLRMQTILYSTILSQIQYLKELGSEEKENVVPWERKLFLILSYYFSKPK